MEKIIHVNLAEFSVETLQRMARETSSKELLEFLSKHSHERIKAACAENEHNSNVSLYELSRDECWRIRIRVAKNKSTLEKTLKLLLNDKDPDVKAAARSNLDARNVKKEPSK